MVGKRLLLTAKLAFLIFSFTVFPNMSTARSNTNEYSQIKLPAETKKHPWPFCTEDRKPTPQMCHWQSLLGAETVSSSTSGRKKAVYGLSHRCCKGSQDEQICVCHSALGHFYPALCLSSARCEGAAVRELKATA